MKKLILPGILTTAILTLLTFFSYRLGYCNACDKYIKATECKPIRKINLLYK